MRALFVLPPVLQGIALFLILALSVHLSRSARRKARRAQWGASNMFQRINAAQLARRGIV